MRVIFMGTPDFSVPTLTEIIGHGHEVVAVYSQPPRPAGRGMELRKSPVHQAAERFGIPVFTPESLKSEGEIERFKSHEADVAVVVAYGLILKTEILNAPTHGCLNLHASLLPRWRGAAPINRAIMAGDSETGVMVMQMDEGLDTGPVAMAERLPISENMTVGDLHDALMGIGGDLMARALAALSRGGLQTTPQAEEGVTYAHKLEKSETRIDWSRPANEVHNHIRGLSPFPGAWTEMPGRKRPERVKILRSALGNGNGNAGTVLSDKLEIACGSGSVFLTSLQKAGKSAMNADDFLRGNQLVVGTSLQAAE